MSSYKLFMLLDFTGETAIFYRFLLLDKWKEFVICIETLIYEYMMFITGANDKIFSEYSFS